MSSYYIFGGSGFIGTHLTNQLHATNPNTKIYNLDIQETNHNGLSTFLNTDVRKPIKLPNNITPTENDIFVNLAAVHRTPGHEDHEYFETNIQGAENVCALANQYNVRRIIFTSSIAPYSASEDEKFETTLPTPNTAYGISKLVAEKIHSIWAATNPDRELTILRPGVTFGLGEHGNFTRLYWSIRRRRFAYPGRKDTIKACIYVKDLVGFMLYKLENHTKGTELYNCTYEPAYTIEQIVNHMKAMTGLKTWTPKVPAWLLMPAAYAALLVGQPMGICPARVRKLMTSTNICGKKLANSGYTFKYTFDQALKDWQQDSGGDGLK